MRIRMTRTAYYDEVYEFDLPDGLTDEEIKERSWYEVTEGDAICQPYFDDYGSGFLLEDRDSKRVIDSY